MYRILKMEVFGFKNYAYIKVTSAIYVVISQLAKLILKYMLIRSMVGSKSREYNGI